VSDQQHAPAALYPRERPGIHLQEAGWAPGPVWTDGNSRCHRNSIPDRLARGQLLYRLSYRPHPSYFYLNLCWGTAVAQWLRCCATNRKVAGSIPASVSGFFIDIQSFRSYYGPGVDSASNRNEYQEHFVGVKAAGACAVVMKSGNLNFPEPSGPLPCNGTDLPLHLCWWSSRENCPPPKASTPLLRSNYLHTANKCYI